MDKIISILKQSKLYTDDFLTNYEKVFVNNRNDFLEKYEFNNTANNPLPTNIKRNKDGMIDLDSESYVVSNLKPDGHNTAFYILYNNGSRIIVKHVDETEIDNELLYMELCKSLNIPCAINDVGINSNKKVLISQSFLSPNEDLFDYYKLSKETNYVSNNKFYYDIDIEEIIYKAKEINQDNFVRKMITIDLLTDNMDRFPNNFKVIKTKNGYKTCPLFDNGILKNNCDLKAIVHNVFYKNSNKKEDIFSYLLKNNKYNLWCKSYILNANDLDFKKTIYEDKKYIINNESNKSFLKSIKDNKEIIRKVLNK